MIAEVIRTDRDPFYLESGVAIGRPEDRAEGLSGSQDQRRFTPRQNSPQGRIDLLGILTEQHLLPFRIADACVLRQVVDRSPLDGIGGILRKVGNANHGRREIGKHLDQPYGARRQGEHESSLRESNAAQQRFQMEAV